MEENKLRIADKSIDRFLHDIATKPRTPAGGSIAALCAACAAALTEMVARHTINNKDKSIDVLDYMDEVIQICSVYRENFLEDMDRDTKAYKDVINALNTTEENREECYKTSINIPLEITHRVLNMIGIINKIIKEGNDYLVTDGAAALLIAKATITSLIYHIKCNLIYIKDKDFFNKITNELELIEEQIK